MNPLFPTPGLTDEQHRAVFTREASVLLSSGAGCGKTHVLTERYLAHLREGVEVGQIVAITFTERAARQMRRRIREAVLKHLRDCPEDEAETWTRHLRNLETAPISTIHSFCGTLLRQYAVEAGLDPGFDVLEDVLSINLETEAVSSALQKLLTSQAEAGEDLRELVLLFGWRAINEAVPRLVEQHDARGWEKWLRCPVDELAARGQRFAEVELKPRYLQYLLTAESKIARVLPLLKRYRPQPGPLSENVRLLLDELPQLPTSLDLAAAVERLAEAAKVGRQGAKVWPIPEVYEQIKRAFEEFRGKLRDLNLEGLTVDTASLITSIEVGKRFLRVASEAYREYQDRKRLHGVVDFQDLLVLARDLLRDQPEVRESLQKRYQVLLIDELQDTDPIQMELVEHLCGEQRIDGKLFAVGDQSQSIYRFRGADVHLFHQLREAMKDEGRQNLTLNFRSQPAILDFTNVLLGHRLSEYEPLRAHQEQINPDPCVEFLWSDCVEGGATLSRIREAVGIARRIAAMVDREKLVSEKTSEGKRLRAVRRGDIVLLFRAMSNVHLYEAALREYGIDYYLVGGRAFFAQQEIYDLLNLLRALENPQDEVALAGTLRSPFCCLSDETLFLLRLANGGRKSPELISPEGSGCSRPPLARQGLWAGLHDDTMERVPKDQRERVKRARRNLDRWRSLKDQLPIARLLGEVFADSAYDAAVRFEFLGDRKLANLWKLVDLARTFDRSGLFGLAEFIARLGDLVRDQPREEQAATQPENADVVRLMTIHQAKGLEFPVVIIPDMNAKVGGSHPPVAHWDARLGCVVRPPSDEDPPPFTDHGWKLWDRSERIEDWNESLRTLYVACTRAEDYLILSAGLTTALDVQSPWMQTLSERFDLRTGACLVESESCRARVLGSAVGAEIDAIPLVPTKTTKETNDAGWPEVVPVRAVEQVVFTVEELETFLRGEFMPPIARERDAEDDSDCHDWPTRRERIEPPLREATPRERVFRSVLLHGDMSDPRQWQPLLRRMAGRFRLGVEEARELEEALERFLEQSPFASLIRTSRVQIEVPFLLEWPRKRPPKGMKQRPVVQGVIDLLWQQGKEGGLLWLTTDPLPSDEAHPGRIFWVHAYHQMTGSWPKRVDVYSLADGSCREEIGQAWRTGDLIDRFHEALAARLKANTAR